MKAFCGRNIGRAWKIVDYGINQRLNALVSAGSSTKTGNEGAVNREGAEGFFKLLVGDFAALKINHSKLVVV